MDTINQLSTGEIILLIATVIIVIFVFLKIDSLTRPSDSDKLTGKSKARYPTVNKKMIYKKPVGIVFGRWKRKYVCKDISIDGHCFLIGGSGSGKSSCLVIPTLLSNSDVTKFVLDIKGELSFKSVKFGSDKLLIFNPQNRSTYGYEPFYLLTEKSNAQQILETMQTIAFSLIQIPATIKDPFWKNSARNLLTGLLIFFYKMNRAGFIDVIDDILSRPIEESIKAVMENANPNSSEYRYINQFSGMAEETLGGIVAEMNNHLVIFANDNDIRFAFRDNALKINPQMLESAFSIYLSIREEKLSSYYDVLQLIINQTLSELEKRPEDAEPIIFCIDELPRILSAGKIDRLLDGARTLRSRRVTLFLITQSTEALMSALTENEVADLISNCPYVVVLSASSSKTQRMVCEWCGKFKAKKRQWNEDGKRRRLSISYEDKPIVTPDELMTLQNTGEAILISPYGYSRIQKTPYYKDKHFKSKADEIIKYNKAISKI